jgi:tRNA threonylcarbamoyladenosine biosynthesis protein TsaB
VSRLLLALDTSTRTASVGLYDGSVVSETTWLAGREHSTRLLLEIEASLARVGAGLHDVQGLVVARGPGSFTGVRVGLSVAKGLSAGLGVPAWGIGSLDVLAHAARDVHLPVRAVLEAGRGRYATALYARGEQREPARLATAQQLLDLVQHETFLIGEFAAEARDVLAQHPHVRLAGAAACARRSAYLAELGARLRDGGDVGDPAALDAVYLT